MAYDFTRAALYSPQTVPVFPGGVGLAPAPRVSGLDLRLRDAWWMSKLSHLAYYSTSQWDSELAKVGLSLVASFDHGATQAFLARGEDWAALAFRGTQPDEFLDVLQDLKVRPVAFRDGVKVHRGFAEALDCVWPDVQVALNDVAGLDLWYTGHSLGAALSVLAAIRHPGTGAVSFGCPRVGLPGCDRLAATSLWRIVNACDVVTRVPTTTMGYAHVGREVFLRPDGALETDPDPRSVEKQRIEAELRYQKELPALKGWVLSRGMADHAIPNYTAALENHRESSAF